MQPNGVASLMVISTGLIAASDLTTTVAAFSSLDGKLSGDPIVT